MNLYYLIYSSTPSRVLSEDELQDLLEVCRRENKNHGVTGMLLCLSGMYIQLIEGEKPEIDQLYTNIRNDSRHFDVTTLQENYITERFFPTWTMGFDMSKKTLDDNRQAVDLTSPESLKLLQMLQTA